MKTLSKWQVEARSPTVETKPPKDIAPDSHLNTNPAKVLFELDLKGHPEPFVKAFRRWERGRKEGQGDRRVKRPSEAFKGYEGQFLGHRSGTAF